jgi:hypothetical protein
MPAQRSVAEIPSRSGPPRSGDAPKRTDSGGGLHRVTLNLTPRAWDALGRTVKLTGDSRTDTINRAVQVYAYLMDATHNGGDLYVRDGGSSELDRLVLV